MITKTKTATNLNNFWKFLNVDPLSFNGMYLSCVDMGDSICGDDNIWDAYQMPLSREKLAEIVLRTENEIAAVLGTPVKPTWIREEIEINPVWFNNRLSKHPSSIIFKTSNSYIKRFGQQRLERILEDVPITYNDIDMDGFSEEGIINFTLPTGEELCDVRLYFAGTKHEITGFTIDSYNETTREVSLRVDSWQLIEPSLYITRSFMRNNPAIDGCKEESFVMTVDVWVDAVDTCKPAVEFVFDNSHVCTGNCSQQKQPGCVIPINLCEGTFQVRSQGYDEDNCVVDTNKTLCGTPYKIIVYYQAGCHSNHCQDNCNDDCFCAELEDIVFKVAAARYPYPTCDCKCVSSVLKTYSQQTSLIVRNEGRTFRYSDKYTDNAVFGTTVGEIEAAVSLMNLKEKFCSFS